MYNEFGVKELYEASLKTTDNIVIGGQSYAKDEVFLFFKNLQIANISSSSVVKESSGGKNNFSWIVWDNVKDIDIAFEKGLLNSTGLNMFSQSRSFNGVSNVAIPHREELITDSVGEFITSYAPTTSRPIFVYKLVGGIIVEKLSPVSIVDDVIDLGVGSAFTSVLIDYYFVDSDVNYQEIGGENIKGYFKMTSKISFVDEKEGLKTTVLFVMPKVKIMSNINLTFGIRANPIVSIFKIRALPDNDGKTLARFIYLNQDIEG